MLRSLRSRLILASLLWTGGLLMLMHLTTMLLLHFMPRFDRANPHSHILIGLTVMASGLVAARYALQPFRHLRQRLLDLRSGSGRRIEGSYPTEIQPLVDNLNALLDDREKAVQRAIATAGDLAHGLKTPLALLAQESGRAAASGNTELAASLAQQIDRMSRQVNFHLARARAAASGGAAATPCPIAPSVEALIRTLRKLHATRALHISSTVDPVLHARVQREDLDELLGNLLDNACKWAASRISIEAAPSAGSLVITIDDDGPGIAPALRESVLQRGVRLDQAAPGSGLGLAIVADLAGLYSGSLTLDASPLGGLRARLSLPLA